MNRKKLFLAIPLVIALAISGVVIALATYQTTYRIQGIGNYPYRPASTSFYLMYENGTTIDASQPINGAGLKVNIMSANSPPGPFPANHFVIRNWGNVPFTVNVTVANVVVPSDCGFYAICYGDSDGDLKPSYKIGDVIQPTQNATLELCFNINAATMGEQAHWTPGAPLPYSFDVIITTTEVST